MHVVCIRGPRAAILSVNAGENSEMALKAFTRTNSINLRRTIKWEYTSGPQIVVDGGRIRVEVSWPEGLEQETVLLDGMNHKPLPGDGRWIVGQLADGTAHLSQFTKQSPHLLVAGGSGGGKSTVLRTMIHQLSVDDANQFVLLDGKGGLGLNCVSGCPGVVGPLARDADDIRAALQWTVNQMEYRQEHALNDTAFLGGCTRIMVVFDEPQEFTDKSLGSTDPAIVEMVRRLAVQGRETGIHLTLGTQTPNIDMFGHVATRRQFSERIVCWVEGSQASLVALGTTSPDASNLTGSGDMYCKAQIGSIRRVQGAFVGEDVLQRTHNHPPLMEMWPVFDAEDLTATEGFTVGQIVAGVHQIALGNAGETLGKAAGVGSTKRRKLVKVSKRILSGLLERGFTYAEN